MNKLKSMLLGLLLLPVICLRAEEGMWLPFLLEKMNEKDMKSKGMKISAKDIYSINNGSLKDAIVSFGGFCTGEVISTQGLVLTNHHCGFDAIQNHSSLEHNYIRDGFWAMDKSQELRNPGLFVTFIVRIDDVSAQVLAGVKPGMAENERQSVIDKNINQVNQQVKRESWQKSFVRAFFEGNQYFLFVTETYNDIRLVGAPPSSIGNFGKDSDNWMWPRHTGDFSMFRIYAGKDNKPADYSPDNVPYVPKKALSISMSGVQQNDFTMVFGFPGRTMEYLHSAAVEQTMDVNDPAKIAIRDKALAVIDGFMRKDEGIKIQYAAKYASISNAWKKWQGEVLGLKRTGAVDKKKAYEAEFQRRVNGNPQWKAAYGSLLQELGAAYEELKPYGLARDYYLEITSKIEVFSIINQLWALGNAKGKSNYNTVLARVKDRLADLYNEYSPVVDEQLFGRLMEMYAGQPATYVAASAKSGDYTALARQLYSQTSLTNGKATLAALEQNPDDLLGRLQQDKLVAIYSDMADLYNEKVATRLNQIQDRINQLQRTYMQAQMDVMKEKKFYPDANSTLRVTYGNVKGYQARDAVQYDYYTYLDGVMQKYVPGDYEFDVPARLRELYAAKDYGPYGSNGKMPVCFIASNHTTGGNSGSPALDAWGNLIGLNFDRVWEGTMSDINYDPSICRNIMVDIRYVLFIVDKYAGAGHLVKEMKLVNPKKGS
ncbi:MAG: S46 family peptidase [Chitinophagaceae bacterium]|nr:S46 family peptidase [Chitinophagaceae bacterium]